MNALEPDQVAVQLRAERAARAQALADAEIESLRAWMLAKRGRLSDVADAIGVRRQRVSVWVTVNPLRREGMPAWAFIAIKALMEAEA